MKISKKERRAFDMIFARKAAEASAIVIILRRGAETAHVERRLWDDIRRRYKLDTGKNYSVKEGRIIEDKVVP